MLTITPHQAVEVSYRAIHFGFVFPVWIDKTLWDHYYRDDDKQLLWLEGILDACACELNTHSARIDVVFEYADECQQTPVLLETTLEFDDNIRPYVLIRYADTGG